MGVSLTLAVAVGVRVGVRVAVRVGVTVTPVSGVGDLIISATMIAVIPAPPMSGIITYRSHHLKPGSWSVLSGIASTQVPVWLSSLGVCVRRLTARASADHREAETPTLAQGDNLTRPRQAGPAHRQVYHAENYHTSARHLRTRRGRWSAACAGWAAPGGLPTFLSKRGLRIPTWRLMHGRRR